jgi:hypothetical protein
MSSCQLIWWKLSCISDLFTLSMYFCRSGPNTTQHNTTQHHTPQHSKTQHNTIYNTQLFSNGCVFPKNRCTESRIDWVASINFSLHFTYLLSPSPPSPAVRFRINSAQNHICTYRCCSFCENRLRVCSTIMVGVCKCIVTVWRCGSNERLRRVCVFLHALYHLQCYLTKEHITSNNWRTWFRATPIIL